MENYQLDKTALRPVLLLVGVVAVLFSAPANCFFSGMWEFLKTTYERLNDTFSAASLMIKSDSTPQTYLSLIEYGCG